MASREAAGTAIAASSLVAALFASLIASRTASRRAARQPAAAIGAQPGGLGHWMSNTGVPKPLRPATRLVSRPEPAAGRRRCTDRPARPNPESSDRYMVLFLSRTRRVSNL